ncbi:MBL fold metallo-hydrolase [Fertoebacter nigrum]|uniref:MBL fold metallo-hydrolase n=1 Tax=Fertoeibacter niger TaxID=2656921 RepID=A0A8X8KLE8_9RHOB|nr:MBL fold metallo-hydrolase [Fertoeibacter niger]NUB42755.1 MBL fold metallo-hydrolase [Fertoeibacter niger]
MDGAQPSAGDCIWLEPGLRRVLAPNPSPMTHWGTNSYIIGEGTVALIDPGPDLPAHRAALLAALRPGERISHILVTHAHLDHSPLARPLAALTGATVLAFGAARAGRSAIMAGLDDLGGGEGVDAGFAPDTTLPDGAEVTAGGVVAADVPSEAVAPDAAFGRAIPQPAGAPLAHGPGWRLEALHTPGHFGNHLCFAWGARCFTGDHVMGWAPSLVSPPDGDMAAYMASLARLAARDWAVLYPGHGAPVTGAAARLAGLAAHRRQREAAILAALDDGPQSLAALTARVYADTAPALWPAAQRNLLAHLIDLAGRRVVAASPALSPDALFRRC